MTYLIDLRGKRMVAAEEVSQLVCDRTVVLVSNRRTTFVGGVDVPDVAQATEVGEVFIVVKCHTDVVAFGADVFVDQLRCLLHLHLIRRQLFVNQAIIIKDDELYAQVTHVDLIEVGLEACEVEAYLLATFIDAWGLKVIAREEDS